MAVSFRFDLQVQAIGRETVKTITGWSLVFKRQILGEFRRFYVQILGEICKKDNNDMEI